MNCERNGMRKFFTLALVFAALAFLFTGMGFVSAQNRTPSAQTKPTPQKRVPAHADARASAEG
jgi:hypothetical protein